MRTAILIVVGTTRVVHATPEVELGAAQLDLGPRRDLLEEYNIKQGDGDDESLKEWIRFVGFAQLTGGGRAGGDAAAGVAAAIGGAGCDLAALDVQGRFRPLTDDGEPLVLMNYSVCPIGFGLTLKFDGRRGAGVTPSLSSRRSLWNRAYTDVYDSVYMGLGPLGPHDAHTVFGLSLGHGTTTQNDGYEDRTTKTLDVGLLGYRFAAAGFSIEVLALTVNALKAGTSNLGGVASQLVPVRLGYETPRYFANAEAGWGWTGGQITASGSTMVNDETVSEWSDTIDSEGLPKMRDWIGAVEAGVRDGRIQASGRVARGFFPTFDGNIAREARVSGMLSWTPGRTRRTLISLAPFATRTRTWEREAPSSREIGGGAQLHVGREINQKLRVDAIGEAGVSPYARSGSDRLPEARLGGQFLVALSGRVTDLQR